MSSTGRRLVVGISGASGIEYGVRALVMLRELGVETHLVVTRAGAMTRAVEAGLSASELRDLADVSYASGELGAAVHLRAMTAVIEAGAIVAPPVPAFYARPRSLAEIVDYSVARALDLFGLSAAARRWEGMPRTGLADRALEFDLLENGRP